MNELGYTPAQVAKIAGVHWNNLPHFIQRGVIAAPTHFVEGYVKPRYTEAQAKTVVKQIKQYRKTDHRGRPPKSANTTTL